MYPKNKKAISLMLSYVLLVVMAIALSVGVYSWLKFYVTGAESIEKCPEGVSLIIQDYTLLEGKKIELTVKNKGLFNISGYYIKGTDNKSQESRYNLRDIMAGSISEAVEGTYLFSKPFPPNAQSTSTFSYKGLEKLEKIEIEPFRIQEKTLTRKKNIILCDSAVISQEIIEYGCDFYHLSNCKDEANCTAVGGFWWNFECHSTPAPVEPFNPIFFDSLVSWWKFDETDGGIALDFINANDGNIYGNTRLLMHFDEGSGSTVGDESAYDNDGNIYGNTRLLMRFDEGFGDPLDESAYDNDGTINGATWTASGCQSGLCLSFDGADYINLGDLNVIDTSNEITFCSWVYHPTDTDDDVIFTKTNSNTDGVLIWRDDNGISGRTDTYSVFLMETGSTDTARIEGATNAGTAGTWRHVCFTAVLGSPTGLRLYINGVEDPNSPVSLSSITSISTGANSAYFGIWNGYPAYDFNGLMDETAIYSRALSQSEINDSFNSGRAKFIEWENDAERGSVLDFDGIDDYVEIVDDSSLDISDEVSIGVWVNFNSLSVFQELVNKRGVSDNTASNYALRTASVVDELDFYFWDGTNWHVYRTNNANLETNNWYYITSTYYFGDNSSIRIYLNGSLLDGAWLTGGSLSEATAPPVINDFPVKIGGLTGTISYMTNGTIDEVSIYSKELSYSEITEIYTAGKAKFIERVPGISGNAIDFDGVDDYVNVTNPTENIANVSISMWVNIDSTSLNGAFIKIGTAEIGDTTGYGIGVGNNQFDNAGNNLTGVCEGISWISTGQAIGTGWHHIVYILNETGDHNFYIDGYYVYGTNSCTPSIPGGNTKIGGYEYPGFPRYFNGLIDEVMIFNEALSQENITAIYDYYTS